MPKMLMSSRPMNGHVLILANMLSRYIVHQNVVAKLLVAIRRAHLPITRESIHIPVQLAPILQQAEECKREPLGHQLRPRAITTNV